MMKSKLLGLAMLGLAMGASLPAMAGGPGVYTVKGNNGEPDSDYTGTLTIVQTSKDTFKLTWNIAGDRYDGFTIGDERVQRRDSARCRVDHAEEIAHASFPV
jgi:hypothetical protein